MTDYLKCDSCGAVIDIETGETHIGKDSNANKFKTLQEKYEKLQGDLKRALEENQKLIERIKSGKTVDKTDGGNGDGNGSDEGDKGIWTE